MIYDVEVEFHKDFVNVNGNKITIGLLAKPENNKANTELVKKLARYFKVSSSQVRILSGLRSRRKVVEIIYDAPND
jgi:hypothetical protein